MKSIEERAYEHYPIDRNYKTQDYNDGGWDGYVKGATEQKVIDDKAMDMLNEACDNTIMLEKQTIIDKACESFCKRCVHNQTLKKCMYLGKDCPLLGAFRKDLEE